MSRAFHFIRLTTRSQELPLPRCLKPHGNHHNRNNGSSDHGLGEPFQKVARQTREGELPQLWVWRIEFG